MQTLRGVLHDDDAVVRLPLLAQVNIHLQGVVYCYRQYSEIGKKAWLFAKLQPGRARKRINAT